MSNTKYIIDGDTLGGIADAIRQVDFTNSSDLITPLQMKDRIENFIPGFSTEFKISNHMVNGVWQRPSQYPNLDDINIPDDFDGVYLTYDLRKLDGICTPWIGIGCAMRRSSDWNNYNSNVRFAVQRGHIENHEFVVDFSSPNHDSGGKYRQELDPNDGEIQLWRVVTDRSTAAKANDYIINFIFLRSSDSSAQINSLQPCVERRGILNGLSTISSTMTSTSDNTACYTTIWLQRDKVKVNGINPNCTRIGGWTQAFSLQELDLSEWDTSNWNITSLTYAFYYCMSLQKLDLSAWDTRNWHVTTLEYTWNCACTLKQIIFGQNWDTSNWAVTNLYCTWNVCASLQYLDLNNWDTSNWAVTTLYYTWRCCHNLKRLSIQNWNTSNWAVTTLYGTWYNCYNLLKLDLKNWNTSNWAVTTLYNTWSGCYYLKNLNIGNWVTSNWAVVSLYSTWNNCYSLIQLNLKNWNTSNWAITTLYSTWNNCFRLKQLDLNNWTTSSWTISSLYCTWQHCYSLQSLKINNWNTTNWAVESMSSTWSECTNLKKLELNNWNTTNWKVTTMAYCWFRCLNLSKLQISNWNTLGWKVTSLSQFLGLDWSLTEVDMSSWNASNWTTLTNTSDALDTHYTIRTIYFPSNLTGSTSNFKSMFSSKPFLINTNGHAVYSSFSISGSYLLSPTSLISILGKLPTTSSALTITLGDAHKSKLTSAQIAVATQKGWTVA